jgi:hypothetical protein
MDRRRLSVALLKGAALSLLAVLALFAGLLLRGPWCWSCKGTGGYQDAESFCRDCSGSGVGSHLNIQLRNHRDSVHVILVRHGEIRWEGDLTDLPAVAWMGAGAAVLVGLFVGLKALACPLCARQGVLLLEVEPPGRAPKPRTVECPACEGKGRLTRLDRWLAGV